MTEPVLDYEDISKEYRVGWRRQKVRALDGFSLEVKRGEIFGFLGPNGAGKTTAINLAMGFSRPSGGNGRLLGAPFGAPGARRRIGFLPEQLALHNRSALNLLEFYAQMNGVQEPHRRAAEALDRLGLSDVANRTAMKLSRGMQQRLGLAQAIVNDPDLLILDEPTSALDPVARVAVRELLLEAKANGKTVFLSSHLLSEVETICDRIAILRKGRLVRLGTIPQLLEASDIFTIIARRLAPDHFPQAVIDNGFLTVQVSAADQRQTLEKIWSLGGEVVSVNPVRESLESMFLRLAGPTERERDA